MDQADGGNLLVGDVVKERLRQFGKYDNAFREFRGKTLSGV
jgi:hypothetical protein